MRLTKGKAMSKKAKKQETGDSFVEIDVDNIDEDIAGQSGRRLKWGRKLADAKFDLSEAESELELTKAELDSAIRAKPKKYGLAEKPTEGGIKSVISTQQEYLDGVSAVNKAQREVNYIQAGVTALDHRKSMLGDMVSIIALGWFSDVKVRKHAKDAKQLLDQKSARKGYRRERDE